MTELGLGDTELAPPGDVVMVPHVSPASLTGWPDQEATEIRVGGEQGRSAPAAMASGVSRGGDSRQRDAPQEASEKEKLERASSECRHTGAAKVAARKLVA